MSAATAQRNLTLSGVLAVGAAVAFFLVDCEASLFGLDLTGCAAPRFLQPPASSLGLAGAALGLAAGYLLVVVLALFSLAALRHATRAAPLPASRSRKRPAAAAPAAAPAQAQARKPAPAPAQTSQQVASPVPATCNRRSSPSQAPIVTEQALHRFLMQREGDRRGGSAASATQLPSPNAGASPAWGSATSPIGVSPMPSAAAVGSPPFPNPMAAANNPTSPFGGSPFGGSPGYCASPFASAPSAFSPAPFSGGSPSGPGSSHAVRRVSTSSVDGGGSATKFQRAMYIPTAGDRQEDPGVIALRASKLLQLLHVVDEKSSGSLMPTWRGELRKWMSAGLLQPLAVLFEFNQRRVAQIQAAAAKAPAPAAGVGAGLYGGAGLMGGGLAPRGAAAAGNPFALGGKPAVGMGMGMYGAPAATQEQQAKEAAEKRKKLADEAALHQYTKLQSFLKVPGHEGQAGCVEYVRQRLLDLARGPCVSLYKWDGGAAPGSAAPWTNAFPTDAELLVHVFATFLDLVLPPPADSAAKAPAPGMGGMGGMGGAAANPFAAGGMGVGMGGMGAPAANPFQIGGANPLGGAPAAAAEKKGVFWEAWLPQGREHFYDQREEQRGFSARHFARSTERQKKKSDVVLLQQPGSAAFNDGSQGSMRRNLPRYSVLCEGVEWVVAEGEHNVWEAIVLFLLQRAKRDGFLGGIDLKRELYTAFMAAMHHEGATSELQPESQYAFHGLISVLHPWSEALDQMALDQVNERFSVN